MADHDVDRVGEQVGPYQLTRLLGRGGFGEVYEAEHRLIHKPRAIKLLLERHFHDPKQRERFLREAHTLAELEHPNILPVLEVDEAGDLLYLVTPLYQRGTLSDLLKRQATPLPLAEVEQYLEQVCAALGYAHARGIAHLDLKPDNLLLHEDGRLVLADFGLAHLLKQGRLEAGTSASWGTPYYMAPEQIRGEPEPRSDLYALGVILYQLLTMQRPFTGSTPEAVMMKHMLEAPPALQAVYPAAPAALEPVVQKALAKQPADRYQTAGALLIDFRAALDSFAPALAQPPTAAAAQEPPTLAMPGLALSAQPAIPAALSTPQAVAVRCEIPLPDGRLCGVPPIGRCATCGRAFCTTHQAHDRYNYGLVPYIDMCAPCLYVQRAENAKREAEALARSPRQYLQSGAARTDLLNSGIQPVDIHRFEMRLEERERKRGFFGTTEHYTEQVEVTVSFAHGWILGEFMWNYDVRNDQPYSDIPTKTASGKCLTALLDIPPSEYDHYRKGENSDFDKYAPLYPVEPYSGGYQVLGGHEYGLRGRIYRINYFGHWEEARQAVKRLIGESS